MQRLPITVHLPYKRRATGKAISYLLGGPPGYERAQEHLFTGPSGRERAREHLLGGLSSYERAQEYRLSGYSGLEWPILWLCFCMVNTL